MEKKFEIIIIGAGPGGLSAALIARKYGATVLLLDEQGEPGGQIYRRVSNSPIEQHPIVDQAYLDGKTLIRDFNQCGATYRSGATVWQIDRDLKVCFSQNDNSTQVIGKKIIIATGAIERPMAIPGWTLPGVMGAGAADLLLKSAGIYPKGKVTLCGSGSLMLSIASKLIRLGIQIEAILNTNHPLNYISALRFLPRALKASSYLLKGLKLQNEIRGSKIKVINHVKNIEIKGRGTVKSISFSHPGRHSTLETDTVLLHDGVIPNIQLTRLLNCNHQWHPVQRYWFPVLDNWTNSSLKGVLVAGDTAKILGTPGARLKGELAALEAVFQLQRITSEERDYQGEKIKKGLKKEKAVRPFLEYLFQPNPDFYQPKGDKTIICRCEEITVEQIKAAVAQGCLEPNQVKSYLRSGMGPCQGRICGTLVSEIVAAESGFTVDQVGGFRIRPPLKPIPVQELANLELMNEGE
jgi:thioredoxin reductase/bacterioferritin-associated ferredoxin